MERSEMTFKSVNNRAPYIVDVNTKCLRQLHLTEIVYDLTTGETKMKWIEAEIGNIVSGDLSDKMVYANEEQFGKGEQLEMKDLYATKSFQEIINYATPDRCVHMDGKRPFSWVYENGVATKYYYDERINAITTTFGPDGKCCRDIKTDVEFPEMYYSAEELYVFNDYEIVNNDGTKTFHEALCNRLKLTPEQEALVDMVTDAIKECKKAGVHISFDICDYQLIAFNVSQIERLEYSPCRPDDDEIATTFAIRNPKVIPGVYDINLDDPEWQFIVKKSSLKQHK